MNTQEFLNTFAHLADAPGGVDRLRELILQLAVRGKLVEQDANDEPAEVLLERIEAEKKRLYEAGEIRKPTNPLPVMEDERPFDTPTGWVWTRLGEFALLINGDRGKNYPSKSDRVESGIPFINAGHLKDGRIGMSDMDFITPKRFDLLSRGKVQDDDLLYCLRGSLGKCAVVHGLEHGAIASSLLIIRLLSQLSSSYLFLVLTSPYGNQLVRKYDNGSAQPNLAGSSVAKYSLPLPPLAEQTRIVARVDELMELCDELETHKSARAEIHGELHASALDQLTSAEDAADFAKNWARIRDNFDLLFDTPESVDALRQAILELAVRGKLVEQDPKDEPFPLKPVSSNNKIFCESRIEPRPRGWKWSCVDKLGNIITGGTPPKSNKQYWDGKIPWVSPKDMKVDRLDKARDHISEEGLKNSSAKLIGPGALLFVVRGMILAHSFPVAINKIELTTNQDMKALVLHNPELADYLLLTFKGLTPALLDAVKTSGHGTKRFTTATLKNWAIPIPPRAEQKRILARVDELMELCDEMEKLIRQRQVKAKRFAEAVVHAAASAEFGKESEFAKRGSTETTQAEMFF